jgi:hypothetical protein
MPQGFDVLVGQQLGELVTALDWQDSGNAIEVFGAMRNVGLISACGLSDHFPADPEGQSPRCAPRSPLQKPCRGNGCIEYEWHQ